MVFFHSVTYPWSSVSRYLTFSAVYAHVWMNRSACLGNGTSTSSSSSFVCLTVCAMTQSVIESLCCLDAMTASKRKPWIIDISWRTLYLNEENDCWLMITMPYCAVPFRAHLLLLLLLLLRERDRSVCRDLLFPSLAFFDRSTIDELWIGWFREGKGEECINKGSFPEETLDHRQTMNIKHFSRWRRKREGGRAKLLSDPMNNEEYEGRLPCLLLSLQLNVLERVHRCAPTLEIGIQPDWGRSARLLFEEYLKACVCLSVLI